MSTLDEISGEIKQKTQGAVQFIQQAEHLFEYFAKLANKEDSAADNLISHCRIFLNRTLCHFRLSEISVMKT